MSQDSGEFRFRVCGAGSGIVDTRQQGEIDQLLEQRFQPLGGGFITGQQVFPAAAAGAAHPGRMGLQQVQRQPGVDLPGKIFRQLRHLLVEELAHRDTLLLELLVCADGKKPRLARRLRSDLPEFLQHDLQHRRHRRFPVFQQVVGDDLREIPLLAVLQLQAIAPSGSFMEIHPAHRLDDALTVEALQEHFRIGQGERLEGIADLRMIFLAVAQDQLAANPAVLPGKQRLDGAQEVSQFVFRGGGHRAGKFFLHLIKDHDQRPAGLLLHPAPLPQHAAQFLAGCRSGFRFPVQFIYKILQGLAHLVFFNFSGGLL